MAQILSRNMLMPNIYAMPNHKQSPSDMLRQIVETLRAGKRVFLWSVPNNFGKTCELHLIDEDRVLSCDRDFVSVKGKENNECAQLPRDQLLMISATDMLSAKPQLGLMDVLKTGDKYVTVAELITDLRRRVEMLEELVGPDTVKK